MRTQALGTLRRAQTTVAGFSTPQKVIATLGVLLLAMGAVAFAMWASKPAMSPLFSNLAPADAAKVVEQLDTNGVKYQLTDGGRTILVPQKDVYKQRLAVSAQGLPANSSSGYALLDKQGVTASKFQQQVTYQRAVEGELANTIKALDGVETAVVHLAVPAKDVFLEEKKPATASVLVQTGAGRTLAPEQVQSVVHLVSSSIENLRPDDVTVVDHKGTLLSAGGKGGTSGAGGTKGQQTADYEKRVSQAVQGVLDRVAGPGNAVAQVTADLSFDSTKRTTETFDTVKEIPPLSVSKNKETYTGGGGTATGVLGPDNIQVPGGRANGASNYNKESETANNAVNKVTELTDAAPGGVRRLSVAVVVDQKVQGLNLRDLQDAVSAAAGVNTNRGDTVSLTQMRFDTAAAENAAKEMEAAKAAEKQAQLFDWGKKGLIALLVIAAIVVAVVRARKRTTEEIDHDSELQVLQVVPQEPTPPPAIQEIPQAPPAPAVTSARQAELAAVRQDVTEFVQEQPERVAELLRGWLADRRAS